MTLSEAIRLGSMLIPEQTHHQMYASRMVATRVPCTTADWNNDPAFPAYVHKYEVYAACALGAAAAAGYDLSVCSFPEIRRVCPARCSSVILPLATIIIHLNDVHHWSREAIADWVETLEQTGYNTEHDPLETAAVSLSLPPTRRTGMGAAPERPGSPDRRHRVPVGAARRN